MEAFPLSVSVRAGEQGTGRLLARGQGADLSFQVVSRPTFGAVDLDARTGEFRYSPQPAFAGTDQFSFAAASAGAVSAPATVTVVVQPDAAPSAQDQGVQLLEGGVAMGRLVAGDVDSRALTFAVLEWPRHGALELDPATGAFTYRPAAHFNGSDAFSFVANDGQLYSAPATVSFTVLPVNDPPVAQDGSLQLMEDGSGQGRMIASDVDSAALTYAVADQPAHGALTFDASTGDFTYAPGPDFTGTDTFRFTASDGALTSAPATVNLSVLPVNDPPVAREQTVELLEDSLVLGAVTGTDIDSPVLTFALLQPPRHGTLELDNLTGAFTYRPEHDFNGSDAFRFVANDGQLNSAPATVTVTVLPVNDAPVAHDGALQLLEDTPTPGQLVATDVDSPVLTYTIVRGPSHGAVDLDAATGRFTYHPAQDYNGLDAFQFTAFDGELGSAPATVTLTVLPVNDPPVAQDGTLVLPEDTPSPGQVTAADVDSTTLTYALVRSPAHGQVSLDQASGRYTYSPDLNYNGPDSFQFAASDGQSQSAPGTVSITVTPVNDPPELPVIPDRTNSAETLETFVALPSHDVDGDLIQYTTIVADPTVASARVGETATLILTPLAQGSTSVTVTGSDGVYQASRTFTFTVGVVEKLRRYTVADTQAQAISILNTSTSDVTFELRHDGALLATTGDQLVQEVRALPDEVAQEPFERKLWRFVRDGTYHGDPLTGAYWQHDPLLFMNSIGFGYCDDVTAVYVTVAQQGGYPSRGWLLQGHVVPEIWASQRWSVYDPDLAVYYALDSTGAVAGVVDLAANPTLITNPLLRVVEDSFPYSESVATIYSTTSDNHIIWAPFFVAARDVNGFVLPAGARLTYPGVWASLPANINGAPPPVSAQLRVDLPAGYSGTLDWPLVPWDVQGDGRVRIDGIEYDAGSAELTAVLQSVQDSRDSAQGRPVEIVQASGPLVVVYLVNPMRYGMTPTTEVRLRSMAAGALDVVLDPLPAENRVGYASVAGVTRPR